MFHCNDHRKLSANRRLDSHSGSFAKIYGWKEKNMKDRRLNPEEAERQAARMQELTGKHATKEDYETADVLLTKEVIYDKKKREQSLRDGKVTIIPPEGDKAFMIGFKAKNEKEYWVFNAAAQEATKEYGGFHQVGHNGYKESDGRTAWELWQVDKNDWRETLEVKEKVEDAMEDAEKTYEDLYE